MTKKKITAVKNSEISLAAKMHLHFSLLIVYLFKGQYAELVPSIYQETFFFFFCIRQTPRLH